MKTKRLLALFLAAIMCLALTACSNTNDVAASTPTGSSQPVDITPEQTTITLTESWDFSIGFAPSLNPGNSPNYGSAYWGRNFYNTLLRYDENGEITGELAERWEVSEDGLTYTFHLRDDVLFSDGTPLTAEAVRLSFEAAIVNLGDYNGSFGLLSAIVGSVEVVDDYTAVLHLNQPYYGTLNDLTMSCPMGIVNPLAFGDGSDLTYGEAFQTGTHGTGPYMYEGDYTDGTYTFVRNSHYWGDTPDVSSFKVKPIADNDAKILALRSGEIDAILSVSHVSFDSYTELSSDAAFGTAKNDASTMTRFLAMNITVAPFDDVNVRRAVANAIDVDALETGVFNGLETATDRLFARDVPYCDVDVSTYSPNIQEAEKLLEEAGWIDSDGDGIREKDGVKLAVELNYMTSLSSIDNAALVIASQLSQIGIQVNPVAGDMMTYYAAMATSPMLMAYSYGGAFDPSTFLTNMNPAMSTDPAIVQYYEFFEAGSLEELNATADLNRVQEIYTHVLTTIADEALLVPITFSHELAIWNTETITGYQFSADPRYIEVANIQLG